jgi:hypothetical protein
MTFKVETSVHSIPVARAPKTGGICSEEHIIGLGNKAPLLRELEISMIDDMRSIKKALG